MSEYHYYEFQAIDRPLSKQEMAELRAISTRATITPSRFMNVYNWGDFKGNPQILMEKYFDAFVYVANWRTHAFMLRLPQRVLNPETAWLYCLGEEASARVAGDHIILEFVSEEEPDGWEDGEEYLPALVPLRSDLANADLRALYLGWLLCAQTSLDDDEIEPPVPQGLHSLTASLKAFADFLRIDEDLIAVASERSTELTSPSTRELEQWVHELADSEKNKILLRLAKGDNPHLRAEILHGFQQARLAKDHQSRDAAGSRTVAQLLAASEERAATRRRLEAEREADERARREREQAETRARYLVSLTGREEEMWRRVEALVETKRSADYDQAVRLLKDLRDLEIQAGSVAAFKARLGQLRDRHAKKPSLLKRLEQAQLLLL